MKKQIADHSPFLITLIICLALTGCGSSSSKSSPSPGETTLPGKVMNVNATDGEYRDKIVLTWDPVEGATSYAVYSSIQEDKGYSRLDEIEIIGTSLEDTNVIIDKIHYYKVSALNSAGEGELSDSDAGNSHDGPPGIPENVSATDGRFEDKIEITWTPPESGASGYKIYRAISETGNYSEIAKVEPESPDTLTYDDPVDLGQEYFYKICSITAQGESDFSDADRGYTEEGPQGPTNVSASDGSYRDKIVIQWNASESALSYKVFRADNADGEYEEIATVEAPDPASPPPSRYDDKQMEWDQEYFYKIMTVFAERESKLSKADSGHSDTNVFAPPENVSASDGEEDVINVAWDDVSGDSITYQVLRQGPDEGGFVSIATDLNVISYPDYDIKPCTTYSYQVKATNGENTSHPSSYDDGYATTSPPETVPDNLTASTDNDSHLLVSWETIEGNSGDSITYNLYRSIEDNGPFIKLAEQNQSTEPVVTFIDETAHVDVDYFYKISAVNHGCSETDLSEPVRGFIPIILPAPEGLTLDSKWTLANGMSIDVSWNDVTGAASYLVQRSSYNLIAGWSNWKDITNTHETLYSDDWKLPGTKYRYRVRALGVESGMDGSFCDPEEIVAN